MYIYINMYRGTDTISHALERSKVFRTKAENVFEFRLWPCAKLLEKHPKKSCWICLLVIVQTLRCISAIHPLEFQSCGLPIFWLLLTQLTQDSEGPYAWESALEISSAFWGSRKRHHNGDAKSGVMCPTSSHLMKLDKVSVWMDSIPISLRSTPGLKAMLEEARTIGCIDFRLPPLRATSGVVLSRAIGTIEGLFSEHYPLIFKVGYCHNCVFRWANPLYGYAGAREKWSHMCVLYISDEHYSVSMLEAALIEKYGSILPVF
jgi:hypothetical protein